MTVIKDKLTSAIEARNAAIESKNYEIANDINSFVWKGPKEELNGQKFQDEIKLVDASDEQLVGFYEHCKSMLYSKDPLNPGRFVLIDLIQQNREKCNTELYLRYLEGVYKPDSQRPRYPRFMYLQDMKKYLSINSDKYPQSHWNEIRVSDFTEGMPEEFSQLTIEYVISGCLDTLGKIVKKPITLNFLTKLGIWLTPDEMRDLTEKDEKTGKVRDRMEVIKERLCLKPTIRLKANPTGLSYNEFRAMTGLKNQTFSKLTTDQLIALRNKVLFRLENEVVFHAEMWQEQLRRLELVAESRGWSFNDPDIL